MRFCNPRVLNHKPINIIPTLEETIYWDYLFKCASKAEFAFANPWFWVEKERFCVKRMHFVKRLLVVPFVLPTEPVSELWLGLIGQTRGKYFSRFLKLFPLTRITLPTPYQSFDRKSNRNSEHYNFLISKYFNLKFDLFL